MSAFREAVRQMLTQELICRGCGAENIPGREPTVCLEDDTEHAGCAACGRYGPVVLFRRQEIHR